MCSVPVVLVGNKKDLHMDRVVTQEEGRRLAESWKAVFLEASAKQNEVTSKKVSNYILFFYFFLYLLFIDMSLFYNVIIYFFLIFHIKYIIIYSFLYNFNLYIHYSTYVSILNRNTYSSIIEIIVYNFQF